MVIFDVDGVLADVSERKKRLIGKNKKIFWKKFFMDCKNDKPIYAGILIAKCVLQYLPLSEILFLTSRCEFIRDETETWISEHLEIPKEDINLIMREEDNMSLSSEYKEKIAKEIGFENIDLVFEDNDNVVQMWRNHGITCYQTQLSKF